MYWRKSEKLDRQQLCQLANHARNVLSVEEKLEKHRFAKLQLLTWFEDNKSKEKYKSGKIKRKLHLLRSQYMLCEFRNVQNKNQKN